MHIAGNSESYSPYIQRVKIKMLKLLDKGIVIPQFLIWPKNNIIKSKAFLSCSYYLLRGSHILGPERNRISNHLLYVLCLHVLHCSPSFFLGNFIFILFFPVCHLATSKKGKLGPGILLFQAPWPTHSCLATSGTGPSHSFLFIKGRFIITAFSVNY